MTEVRSLTRVLVAIPPPINRMETIVNPMDEIRKELGYEYDASLEFDMPLDFYGDDVSAETNQEVGA